jgi:two-component system cell cycle sensor histidine kinase/response regulator CckA
VSHPDDAPTRPPAAGPLTILLVEDERPLRELLRRTLVREGYDVLLAADGSQGVGIAGEPGRRIHLLVTDVAMPVMSGHELAERFRALHPDVPILFISGFPGRANGVALRPGEGFLAKPFALAAFLQKVRELVDRRPPGTAPNRTGD